MKFYYYISSFKLKFGHLFDYNFDSQEFEELILRSEQTSDYFKSAIKKFELNEGDIIEAPDFDIYLKNHL
ncbi:hypothetical protein [Formosa algae]|uniref:hypothetical protein n=1 Tax=Formosa algae TaxID=225843 RepID=UPI000CCF3E97|nr:hypothetical protein [Formosa algae]PNW27229.1 hypothetical protein BKP44_14150 [Formosa algae]